MGRGGEHIHGMTMAALTVSVVHDGVCVADVLNVLLRCKDVLANEILDNVILNLINKE